MTIEIINRNRYEHWQFKMSVTGKTFFQFLQSLFKFVGGFMHTLLADIFEIEFVVSLHADLLHFALRPMLLHFLFRKLVCLSKSLQLFVGWHTSTILQLAHIARGKAEPLCDLFDTPVIRFSLL